MTRAMAPPTLRQTGLFLTRDGSSATLSKTVPVGGPVIVFPVVKIAEFGAWESPLSAASVAASEGQPRWVDLHGGRVWWTETRPTEGGRVALLHEGSDGQPVEVLPAPWNARN